ncbi:MAG: acriflavine resistance protein B [Verrucomicrobiales bacterium]|nr:acriflavine resistance protein B [Verrucomicrobiales bacterium]
MNALIAWFARNGVAANLLMVFIILAGLNGIVNRLPVEVFPDFGADEVEVLVNYRGATPEQVEEAIVQPIEMSIGDLVGVEEIRSTASEGRASVDIEVAQDHDPAELRNDIKNRIDGITSFPEGIEPPVVRLEQSLHEVLTLILHGDLSENDLRKLGEQARDEIGRLEGISRVKMRGVRNYEIAIEVSETVLREHGLTLQDVADAVRRSAVDIPGGNIRTHAGDILVRTEGRAHAQAEFEKIIIQPREDGTHLTLGELATISDGFEEDEVIMKFNGRRCIVVHVARTGNQNALEIAAKVKDFLVDYRARLPEGVAIDLWNDRASIVSKRLNTLSDSALYGGIFIITLLGLFLRPAVALWVCVGIPVAFMGGFALMPWLGVSINLFTLYGFILVLGIVVDDAIVTGEIIHVHQQRGGNGLDAAIRGTQEIAVPVIFGVLTTVIAFTPLMMVEGRRGLIFMQIPAVVIPVLLFSLVESKLILPAHLKYLSTGKPKRAKLNPLARIQRTFADSLEWFVEKIYQPVLSLASRHRYVTLCLFLGVGGMVCAYTYSGHIKSIYFPQIDSEYGTVRLIMPQGTPLEVTGDKIDQIRRATIELQGDYTGEFMDPNTGNISRRSLIEDILITTGGANIAGVRGRAESGAPHIAEASFHMVPPEDRGGFLDTRIRDVNTRTLIGELRKKIGPIPGAEELTTRAVIGRFREPIAILLKMPYVQRTAEEAAQDLQSAANAIKAELRRHPGLFDINDTFERSKEEAKPDLKPSAMQRGFTRLDVGQQVSGAFFGHEAQRVQRGQNEIRVMVRYPRAERESLAHLEAMHIRAPDGADTPLAEIADIRIGTSYTAIRRTDLARTLMVFADADKEKANLEEIRKSLEKKLATIAAPFPGMIYSFEGEGRERQESFAALHIGGIMVLLGIYAMLAIPFRSYLQPLIVMSVIPFGLVGAVLGHMVMGAPISIMSAFGALALCGVVVNDSLVMAHYINRSRDEGLPLLEAVRAAGGARFRPILLTSLTTFGGILPTMFESSTQAKFVIPMGISLGWGILFATFITLLLIPICYLILEDIRSLFSRYWAWQTGRKPTPAPA